MNRKYKYDVEKELSWENLNKFVNGLRVLYQSEGELTEKANTQFMKNLDIMNELSLYIARQKKDKFTDEIINGVISLREALSWFVNQRVAKPFASKLLKIRDNLNRHLSQFNITYPEGYLSSKDDSLTEEELEGKSKEDIFNYYVDSEIRKLKEHLDQKELDRLKANAKQQAMDYVYSHGEIKPKLAKTPDEELAQGILEFYNEMKQKTNYCIKLNEDLSSSEEELTETQKLSKYLDKVSEVVLKADSKKEK